MECARIVASSLSSWLACIYRVWGLTASGANRPNEARVIKGVFIQLQQGAMQCVSRARELVAIIHIHYTQFNGGYNACV